MKAHKNVHYFIQTIATARAAIAVMSTVQLKATVQVQSL